MSEEGSSEDGNVPQLARAGLIKQRYEKNPFVGHGGFVVPTKNRRETLQTMGPASVQVDGQKIDVAQIVRVRQVDAEKFVKVFVAELSMFYDLNQTSIRLLTVLLKVLSDPQYINADKVVLTEGIAKQTMKEHGQKPLSSASYYRAVNELIAAGFIAPSTTPPLYYINPAVLFNGDRVRFITELHRERALSSEQNRISQKQTPSLPYDPETGEIINQPTITEEK